MPTLLRLLCTMALLLPSAAELAPRTEATAAERSCAVESAGADGLLVACRSAQEGEDRIEQPGIQPNALAPAASPSPLRIFRTAAEPLSTVSDFARRCCAGVLRS